MRYCPSIAVALFAMAGCFAATYCRGVTFVPGAAEIAAAAADGDRIARIGEGYPLGEYLVYQVADARTLAPKNGCVDAIVAVTPLERTRHAAYVATVESRRVDPVQARNEADLPDHGFGILVYAHGLHERDPNFTERFRDARLLIGSREVRPTGVATSAPVDGIYPLASGDRHRPVATVTWRFDLSGLADDTTPLAWLSFTDACDRELRIAVPLAVLR